MRLRRQVARAPYFHGMSVFQAKMERKQGFLFRAVDIVMELFVMTATLSRAKRFSDDDHPDAKRAIDLADLHSRVARRRIKRLFRDLWANEDARKNKVAAAVLKGDFDWVRVGAMDMGWTPETFRTRAFTEIGREMSIDAKKGEPAAAKEEPQQAAAS